MELKLEQKSPQGLKTECLALFFPQDEVTPQGLDAPLAALVEQAVKIKDFTGKKGQTRLLITGQATLPRLLLVGLGKAGELTHELLRRAAGTAGAQMAAMNVAQAAAALPHLSAPPQGWVEAVAQGLKLGAYRFTPYQSPEVKPDEDQKIELKSLTLLDGAKAAAPAQVKAACGLADAQNLARDLGNHPSNVATPQMLADEAQKVAKRHGLKCTVLDEKQLEKLGMNLFLGVGKGSRQPPRLIVLEYHAKGAKETLMVVGKGITFDSGGISIKPSASMDEMKFDMCGAAAAIASMEAIGQTAPGVNVVAIVPACENMPGGLAQKPGDIVKGYGGKTVEILNTDAEGRLILADALAYGVDKYKPNAIVDLATLTGACVIALGHYASGAISNNPDFQDKVVAAGRRTGEVVWPLPAFPEYEEGLKSKVADLQNIGPREGGTITAGLFLKNFVGETPWVHLDIAGTAWDVKSIGHIPNQGATGVGVALLADLANNWGK